jgi:hypothetical protein
MLNIEQCLNLSFKRNSLFELIRALSRSDYLQIRSIILLTRVLISKRLNLSSEAAVQ